MGRIVINYREKGKMDMLLSFWRGVNSLVEQPRASDKINNNNNFINTMLPAEMLQRIFRLIQIILSYKNIMQFGNWNLMPYHSKCVVKILFSLQISAS